MSTLDHRRELLTVHETAERLGVSEKTVRRKIEAGQLPAVQLGGRGSAVRIDERELAAWLYGPLDIVRADLQHLQVSPSVGSRGARDESAVTSTRPARPRTEESP